MADIETTLMSLNPMDFVTGMKRGFELGQSRAEEEKQKAQAGVEVIKAEEFANEPNTALRASQVATNTAQSDLQRLLYGQETEIAQRGHVPIVEGRLQQLTNIRDAAKVRGIEIGGQLDRVPMEEQIKTDLTAERFGRRGQIVEEQRIKAQFDSDRAAAERGDFAATERIKAGTRGAADALAKIAGDPANAGMHPYDAAEKALGTITDPYARQVLQGEQRKIAQQELQRAGNNIGLIQKWLPRMMPGADVKLRPDNTVDIGWPVTVRVRDPDTKQITERTEIRYNNYSNNPQDRENFVGNFIDQVSGAQRPFMNAPTIPRTTGTTDAGQIALTDQGKTGSTAVRSNAPAAGAAATPAAPAAGKSATQPAMGPPTPLQAQTDELTGIERSLTQPGFQSADDRKAAGVLNIIRQLKQQPTVLNPDTLTALRRLAGEASVPAVPIQPGVGAEFGGMGGAEGAPSGIGLPQALARPQTIEEQIKVLVGR